MNYHIHNAAGILIKNKKLLVERSIDKDYYIAPGGSVEKGESVKQALIRELLEEFRIKVYDNDLEEFGTFTAQAEGQENKIINERKIMYPLSA